MPCDFRLTSYERIAITADFYFCISSNTTVLKKVKVLHWRVHESKYNSICIIIYLKCQIKSNLHTEWLIQNSILYYFIRLQSLIAFIISMVLQVKVELNSLYTFPPGINNIIICIIINIIICLYYFYIQIIIILSIITQHCLLVDYILYYSSKYAK